MKKLGKKSGGCEMVRVQARGQITLPVCFRRKLRLDPEDWLVLYLEDGKIVIKRIKEDAIR
jgi:AbrB family looped-hinge helix DNA binding protein